MLFNKPYNEGEYLIDQIISQNTNGLFIVENTNMNEKQGGIVQWKEKYYLRHLTTNKYLKVGSAPFYDIDENVFFLMSV